MDRCTALSAREYKLLLNAKCFKNVTSMVAANQFWNGRINPIIASSPDWGSDMESGRTRTFGSSKLRPINFWDTGDHRLDGSKYILRDRTIAEGKEKTSKRELTLKLRTPDLFIAAGTGP